MRNSQRSTVRIRPQRSVWRDPRFIIGFILILASIAAVSIIVAQARAGTPLYYVTTDIAPGEALTPKNTATVNARTGADVYLRADEELHGRTAAHALRAGELIPRQSAQTPDERSMRTFVITVGDGLPEDTQIGSELDLWFVPDARIGNDEPKAPEKVEHKTYPAKTIGATGSSGSTAGTRIEVRTSTDGIQQILGFTRGNGTLAAVPVGRK